MMKNVLILSSCLFLLPACATLSDVIGKVNAYVGDAQLVLGLVDNGVQEFFRTHPDIPVSVRNGYSKIYGKAAKALRLAVKAAKGAKALDDKKVVEAFIAFKAAYDELMSWLEKNKISKDGKLNGSKLEAPSVVFEKQLSK